MWRPTSMERSFCPLSLHKSVGEWRLFSEVSTRILGHLHSRCLTWEGSMRHAQHKHESGIEKTTRAGQTAQWLGAHVAHSEDPSLVPIRLYNCLQSCPRGPVRPSFGPYRYLHSSSRMLTHSHTNTTQTHKHSVYILKFTGNNKSGAFLISLGAGSVLTLPVGPC